MRKRLVAARRLLAPLSLLYGAAGWARRQAHARGLVRQSRLAGPVISVGNLSVGGSGKTPVVAVIAEMVRGAGHPVAVLSRGYRGAFKGEALIVSDGRRVLADAALAGDEPVMLARELPGVLVAVGPRRDRVGRVVEARFGPQVHVLDDGFQHLRLARDLDVVCVASEDLDDWPLPAGRLRERASAARYAQALLVSGGEDALRAARSRFGAERVFRLRRHVVGFVDHEGHSQPAPERPFAFCGIARPKRFLSDLQEQVLQRAGQMLFRDHHAYGPEELASLVRYAMARGADALVTTAKDAARVSEWQAQIPLRILKTSVTIEPGEEFRRLVLAAIEERRQP